MTSATTQATSGADCWGQSIPTPATGYDVFGNLQKINVSQCTAPALNLSPNNANQFTNPGLTYGIGGNLLTDGVYTYTWDGEGRLTAANGVTYCCATRRVPQTLGKQVCASFACVIMRVTSCTGLVGSARTPREEHKEIRRHRCVPAFCFLSLSSP